MEKLTEKELEVLKACFVAQSGIGDFFFIEDIEIEISINSLKGYLGSLTKKSIISSDSEFPSFSIDVDGCYILESIIKEETLITEDRDVTLLDYIKSTNFI